MTVIVEIRFQVRSNVKGKVGNWMLRRPIGLARVPVAGDDIVWQDGWATKTVKRVTLSERETTVELNPVNTDSPDLLAELDKMVALGWEQIGGPWQ